ncbi:IucA/IucC family protein [Metabacillus halosaccharovorans]|uniref:Siderophore biosynthesis protein n=1 Tax=Metabacillus halosaccharovorans TaxID=930124 RepID=A0ABT3DNE2_9BACI|nr:IucA/IucC family protein [Metabacillus halosaccharovorans]MCV9888051.1 siderophore biosynthesis protein [Metabacillus halosaccharovorans]
MDLTAKQIAVEATLQAFLNCYLREVDSGFWTETETWKKENGSSCFLNGRDMVELHLHMQGDKYAFEVLYQSQVGKHQIGISLKYCPKENRWKTVDRLNIMMNLIQELHLMARANGCYELASHYDELILRVIESYQTMTHYIEERKEDLPLLSEGDSTFIENEQSLLFGHWLHPTPKSRQGMSNWQQQSFAPELKGKFQLHYFQVDQDLITESSSMSECASTIILQSLVKNLPSFTIEGGTCLIPMHPLQAQWLLQQDEVKKAMETGTIKDLGVLGPHFTATSSIRTVYCEKEDWMYKFSIPVKVTNSLRVNKKHELKAGVVMSSLLKKLPFLDKYPSFSIIEDPAYMTVDFPFKKESGFEVIMRSNRFKEGDNQGISSIASIVQDPFSHQKSQLHHMIVMNAHRESRSVEEVSLDWFDKYWACSIEPLIRLYDEHGIALEAHQQNSVLDVSSGYPEHYYYRDNQGYYLSSSRQKELLFIEPGLFETSELFYNDNMIQERFTYYLVVNQLFSVIYRFGADQLLTETALINMTVQKLHELKKNLTGQGKRFVHKLLHEEKLSHKANLLTRFHNVDELTAELEQAIYTQIANPLFAHHKEEKDAKILSYTF